MANAALKPQSVPSPNGSNTGSIGFGSIMIMYRRNRQSVVALLNVAVLFLCGCGDHPDAGTVDMSAAKKAGVQRGIAEVQAAGGVQNTRAKQVGHAPGQVPTKALPKGGR
jgi:hypothetical protein